MLLRPLMIIARIFHDTMRNGRACSHNVEKQWQFLNGTPETPNDSEMEDNNR